MTPPRKSWRGIYVRSYDEPCGHGLDRTIVVSTEKYSDEVARVRECLRCNKRFVTTEQLHPDYEQT